MPLNASATAVDSAAKHIPPDELLHIDSFKRPEIRTRQLLAHAALRALIAKRLDTEPRKVLFRIGEHGKPMLAGGGALHFNLSHSSDLALVAMSQSVEVGVDVEHLRAIRDLSRLAGRFFAPAEAAALASLPEAGRNAAFFRVWTRKEALLKATGQGIANGLKRFEVSGEPDGGLIACDGSRDKAREWTLHTWSPAEGYIATVAAPRPNVSIVFKPFTFATS